MAAEVTAGQRAKLVKLLKDSPGNSERWYADATGIPQGSIGSVLYACELEADPKLKVPATANGVLAARKKGLRWPRIAAYSGLTVGAVKKLIEESGADPNSAELYTGRGRKVFEGTGVQPVASGKRGAKPAAGPKPGTSGRRGAAAATAKPAGTSGRRGAAAAKNR